MLRTGWTLHADPLLAASRTLGIKTFLKISALRARSPWLRRLSRMRMRIAQISPTIVSWVMAVFNSLTGDNAMKKYMGFSLRLWLGICLLILVVAPASARAEEYKWVGDQSSP